MGGVLKPLGMGARKRRCGAVRDKEEIRGAGLGASRMKMPEGMMGAPVGKWKRAGLEGDIAEPSFKKKTISTKAELEGGMDITVTASL